MADPSMESAIRVTVRTEHPSSHHLTKEIYAASPFFTPKFSL